MIVKTEEVFSLLEGISSTWLSWRSVAIPSAEIDPSESFRSKDDAALILQVKQVSDRLQNREKRRRSQLPHVQFQPPNSLKTSPDQISSDPKWKFFRFASSEIQKKSYFRTEENFSNTFVFLWVLLETAPRDDSSIVGPTLHCISQRCAGYMRFAGS